MSHLFLRLLSPAICPESPADAAVSEEVNVAGEATSEPVIGNDDYELHAEWLITGADRSVQESGVANFSGLSDLISSRPGWFTDPADVVVILPSEFVLTVKCEVPGRNASQIRRALPFAVEEYVASDIEQMHIAASNIKPGQAVTCDIVSHENMQNWLQALSAANIYPGSVVGEGQLLAAGEAVTTLLFENNSVLIATNDQAASVNQDNLDFVLSGVESDKLYCVNGELTDLQKSQLDPLPDIEVLQADSAFAYLVEQYNARTVTGSGVLNLLQGEYQPAKRTNPAMDRWKGVLALAAVWLVVAFAGMLVQAWWADREADRLQAESFEFYKELFPSESQPVSVEQLRRRMNAKLGRSSQATADTEDEFTALLAHLANTVNVQNKVSSLSYQRQELAVEIMLSSYNDLDPIKDKLAGVGVTVDVTSAEQEQGGVRSRMRLKFGS